MSEMKVIQDRPVAYLTFEGKHRRLSAVLRESD